MPYRKVADVIEASNLEYILRTACSFSSNEVDCEMTHKDEPERGSDIFQKNLATFITKIIETPKRYSRENVGINKPNS
jgi:hypothetical protein